MALLCYHTYQLIIVIVRNRVGYSRVMQRDCQVSSCGRVGRPTREQAHRAVMTGVFIVQLLQPLLSSDGYSLIRLDLV